VGSTVARRRPVDAAAAFAGYCACDEQAQVDREAYLSAFWFNADFHNYMRENDGSPRGYNGACWAPFAWWDIDRADVSVALADARRLVGTITARYYEANEDELLLFFSGNKGFHVGLPTALWKPAPSIDFNRTARRFAEMVAAHAGVAIDSSIYDQVRPFRAPNSRHPKTGLHKRRLTHAELMHLRIEHICTLAKSPEPFELDEIVDDIHGGCRQAAADWQTAIDAVSKQAEVKASRRAAAANGAALGLNRRTLEVIRGELGADDQCRVELFRAAANLAEFGCPPALAQALLTEAGLDAGVTPSEVRRQIECGLNHVSSKGSSNV
jgi:hypothetical protein